MAKYFMELMLVDYESTKFLPSEKAAAALCLALKLLDDSEWVSWYCYTGRLIFKKIISQTWYLCLRNVIV